MSLTDSKPWQKITGPLLVFTGVGLLLYGRMLFTDFSADDFRALYRAGVKGEIFVNGFYRPLSDLSLLLTYKFAGANPFWYHLTNLLVHIGNSVLIYVLFSKLQILFTKQPPSVGLSWFASLLFICFPFHNEGVVWVVGRGASMATFFALITLISVLCDWSFTARALVAGFAFFVGLQAYESIVILPMIVFVLASMREDSRRQLIGWIAVSLLVIVLYLVCRWQFAGSIAGEYRLDLWQLEIRSYFFNFFKAMGRLIVPPSDQSALITVLFCGLVGLYLLNRFMVRKTISSGSKLAENSLLVFILITLLITAYFPVSTRTSEGDRLLYFPSVFLCSFLAFLITRLVKNGTFRLVVIGILGILYVSFLESNNKNWIIASGKARTFLDGFQNAGQSGKRIYVCNIPGEFKGAYIFRNVFEDVLLLKHIDTTEVSVVNYLNNAEQLTLPARIFPVLKNDTVAFSPSVKLTKGQLVAHDFEKPGQPPVVYLLNATDLIFYWDKESLRKFLR